ncbi:hypothetical protein [Streptomyces sp. H27-C3]|uniref:hypothetical protein n=1 Tax=Streptomyces sp. H27-C3 TaxID=3046305 RepID=UPI0024B9BF87|nr:hypothetical protein [Streptomyces sp. H27-C3]MDJ0463187.1 hypothetical protein [Streptomyces sp. H27-C3]
MIDYIEKNPILSRTVVVGLLTALVHFVPGLAGVEANEAVVGGINTLLVLSVGLESRTKVTANQHVLVDARKQL